MKTLTFWLLTISLVTAAKASSQDLSSCHYPSFELAPLKKQFTEVGQANLKVWFWHVYNSKLYTPTGKYQQSDPCVIFEINYQMDIAKTDLIDSTIDNWQHLGVAKNSYQPFIKSLHTIWPDVADGDQLTLIVNADKSTFYFNGNNIGSINSKTFGPLFLSIWLSKDTTQPKLRKRLLEGVPN